MTRLLSTSFFGGPWDGLQYPITASGAPVGIRVQGGVYGLERIDRIPGPDGIDAEVASYEWFPAP